MGKSKLNQAERDLLRKNANVVGVTKNRIIYSNAFKHHFIEKYLEGKKPTEIFREAGLDVSILGPKRIERASARWRALYREGNLSRQED